MSWIGSTIASLILLTAVPEDPPRAGRLVRGSDPVGAVILLSERAAWSPQALEGTEVCGPDDRCAPIVAVHPCVPTACPFEFGFEYELAQDVATLPPLPPVDEPLLVTLEREPSLRPLVDAIRRHRSPAIARDPDPPPEPDPPPDPLLVPSPPPPVHPPPVHPPPPVVTAPEPPPGPPSWAAYSGWSLEGTAVPLIGPAFDDADDTHFAAGGVVTTGFRYQLEIPAKQRLFGAAFLGNQFGANIDLTVVNAVGTTRLGVALDFVARTVYAPIDERGPHRLRIFSMVDMLLPSAGVLFDLDGTVHPHIRFAAPISILLRERVGLEFRIDMNVMLRDGPIEGYILLGAGVMLRQPFE